MEYKLSDVKAPQKVHRKIKERKKRKTIQVDIAYETVKNAICRVFFKFGVTVGRYPKVFSLVTLFVSLGLGLGIMTINENRDTEHLFTPVGSRIFRDRKRVNDLFPDSTSWNFDFFGLTYVPSMATMVFRRGGVDTTRADRLIPADVSKDQVKYNIFDPGPIGEIRRIVAAIKAITVKDKGKTYTTDDLCARSYDRCVQDGEQYITEQFVNATRAHQVSYPLYFDKMGPQDLSFLIAGVSTTPDGKLEAARVMKIRFFWRVDSFPIAVKWNQKFIQKAGELSKNLKYDLKMVYSSSESLENELLETTSGDVIYFTLTILMLVTYSILVSAGGDVVSTRALLACGGVLAAALGIVSSLGILCLAGQDYVGFVGIMPYLVLGIGVDDMFLLMSSWGESMHHDTNVPQRVGLTFSKAGISITITTITDFLAFIIGTGSTFIAIRQFCLFTALAVLFCYLCNCTLFGACLSLHGDRVYAAKHCLTCQPVKTREEYENQGATACKVYCCGGSVPTLDFEDESLCERLPRFLMPRLVLNPVSKVLLLVLLVVLLAGAVYGAIQLKPGMRYVDLVLTSSYFYDFSYLEEAYFGQRLAIAFIVDREIEYAGEEGDIFRKLLNDAQRDPSINSTFLRCWLHQYSRSPLYPSQPENHTLFLSALKVFLKTHRIFMNDVHFNANKTRIIASRCYVLTINDPHVFSQSEMMVRMRNLADSITQFPVIPFQPVFVMLEHTIAILPSTLLTVGSAVGVMFLVTLMMLPQLLMVCLVTLNITAIITCLFGSMYYLEISFSGISMIHILMSVGFSVDFSAHICAAYLMSNSSRRQERARYALVHASAPIFSGGMSSLVGVSMLLLSESYFFKTFFKIMSMVITIGIINSVFFMPTILSLIGPENPESLGSIGPEVISFQGNFSEENQRPSVVVRRLTIPAPDQQMMDKNKEGPVICTISAANEMKTQQPSSENRETDALGAEACAACPEGPSPDAQGETVTIELSATSDHQDNVNQNQNNALQIALSTPGALAPTQKYVKDYLESLETVQDKNTNIPFTEERRHIAFVVSKKRSEYGISPTKNTFAARQACLKSSLPEAESCHLSLEIVVSQNTAFPDYRLQLKRYSQIAGQAQEARDRSRQTQIPLCQNKPRCYTLTGTHHSIRGESQALCEEKGQWLFKTTDKNDSI